MGKKVKSRSELTAKLAANADQIRGFGVAEISVFGSFARDENIKPSSDIDFVLDFQPGKKNFDNLVDLGEFLENLLGRKVEILTRESLKSSTGKHILATARRIAI